MTGPLTGDLLRTATPAPTRRAHVIVVGNEKGGAGKSTLAMHLVAALMRIGERTAAVDLDVRQRTLDRYLENRRNWAERSGVALAMPLNPKIEAARERNLDEVERVETERWNALRAEADRTCHVLVVDSPGGDTHLSRLAHSSADTIVTPINDSFLDFDLLAGVDPETFAVKRPSIYAELVWNSRKKKAAREKKPMDWIVMRNRMSMLDARNKRRVGDGLQALARQIGFRLAPGFAERVIYRELFPKGLTLLDITEESSTETFTMSHLAARQELRDMIISLKLPCTQGKTLPF